MTVSQQSSDLTPYLYERLFLNADRRHSSHAARRSIELELDPAILPFVLKRFGCLEEVWRQVCSGSMCFPGLSKLGEVR